MAKSTAILDLAKRPGMVMHVNPRLQRHGDEPVLAIDISIDGIHLEPDELNALLEDKHAHNALFKSATKGKAAEPMFRKLKSFEVTDKFENCAAVISLGLSDNELEFEDVKIAGVKLTPQVGGQTLMECKVQTEVEDTDDVARLLEHLESECNISLLIGAVEKPKDRKAQKELGLGPTAKAGEDKGGEEGAERTH